MLLLFMLSMKKSNFTTGNQQKISLTYTEYLPLV